MNCTNCGQPLESGRLFCGKCGFKNAEIAAPSYPAIGYTRSVPSRYNLSVILTAVLVVMALGQISLLVPILRNIYAVDLDTIKQYLISTGPLVAGAASAVLVLLLGKKVNPLVATIGGVLLMVLSYVLIIMAPDTLMIILGVVLLYSGAALLAAATVNTHSASLLNSSLIGIGAGLLLSIVISVVTLPIAASYGLRDTFFTPLILAFLLGTGAIVINIFQPASKNENTNMKPGTKMILVFLLFLSPWALNFAWDLVAGLSR